MKGKKFKNTKGITLIALVITIIVLLILAGVALSSVLSQDGIFSRAENATEKYSGSKARETLEIAFSALQMEKYEKSLTLENLDTRVTDEINKMGGEELEDKNQVIVDGYIFKIDRTVPKIIEELGPANGIVISANVSGNKNGWFKEGETVNVTVTGTIKTYSGGYLTKVTMTRDGTTTDLPLTDGKYTISNITTNTEIIINAEDSNNKRNSKTIPIVIRVDNIAPTLTSTTATAYAKRITISATATDEGSGLKHINYSIEPTTIKEGATGTLSSGQEITLNAETSEEYTIKFTAEDNAGNLSTEQSKTVETLGVIKHIKTPTGLKEVNTIDIYGATAKGYNCTKTGTEWQIFYIDEDDDHRVYLISKEYITLPSNTEMTKGSISRGYCWNTKVLDKYKTIIPNTSFTRKFLSEYSNTNASSQENLQATNYMLDQATWTEYNGEKADLAFGGPTLPLFQASYNDICRTSTELGIQKNETGYQIKMGTSEWGNEQYNYGNSDTQKGIYFKAENSIAHGMWLASPSALGSQVMMRTSGTGNITNNSYDTNLTIGFKAVVALKSNVQFTDNGDGTYTIN